MKYVSKPKKVDAILYNGENWDDVITILGTDVSNTLGKIKDMMYYVDENGYINFMTKSLFFRYYQHDYER